MLCSEQAPCSVYLWYFFSWLFPVLSELILPHTNIICQKILDYFGSYVSWRSWSFGTAPKNPGHVKPHRCVTGCNLLGGSLRAQHHVIPSVDNTVLWLKKARPTPGPVLPGAPACVCVLGSSTSAAGAHPQPCPLATAAAGGPDGRSNIPGSRLAWGNSVYTHSVLVCTHGKHSSSFSFSDRIERKIATISLEANLHQKPWKMVSSVCTTFESLAPTLGLLPGP